LVVPSSAQPTAVDPITNVATTDERTGVASGEVVAGPIDIHGRVVDELGRPIRMFALHATHRDPNNWFVAKREWPLELHEQGEFDLVGLAPGRWEITPDAEGLKLRSARLIQFTPEARVDYVMIGAAVVAGFVLDLNGEPLTGAVVELDGERREAHTNASGAFDFEVEPGEHRLRATAVGFGSSDERTIQIGSRDRVSGIELALQRGATLRGTVSDDDDRPLARATIVCDADGLRRFKTDDEGRFEIVGIKPGRLDLHVALDAPELPYPKFGVTTLELKGEEIKEIKLRFARARPVRVVVDVSKFPDPQSIFVMAKPDGGLLTTGNGFMAKSDRPGRLELTLPTFGRFALSLYAEGELISERAIDVPDQDEFELTLTP
jgi:protocatechuate 3,4-dioxygenase beta subunit